MLYDGQILKVLWRLGIPRGIRGGRCGGGIVVPDRWLGLWGSLLNSRRIWRGWLLVEMRRGMRVGV